MTNALAYLASTSATKEKLYKTSVFLLSLMLPITQQIRARFERPLASPFNGDEEKKFFLSSVTDALDD
jgi:hypothetical protein